MSPLAEIPPGASPEEVAAIVAALAVFEQERAAAAGSSAPESADRGARLDAWVRASRLSSRRAGLIRGPWRLSSRIGRRFRA